MSYSILIMAMFVTTTAFCPTPSWLAFHHRASAQSELQRQQQRRPFTLKSIDSDYTESEVEDMEQLIVSISREATDQKRRDRLALVFQDALAGNSRSYRFSGLFNEILMVVGDRVKLEAEQKALQQQQQQEASDNEDPLTTKTPEEQQLWALIDMMVQSKIIVKKAKDQAGA